MNVNPHQVQPNDPPMLKAAFADLGLHETPGPAATARIVDMYAKAGHPEVKSDEVSWCAAAMGAWAVETGTAGTRSLAARSYLNWGQPVRADRVMPRGVVVVFKRGNSTWQGHVALLLEDQGRYLLVIGANQSNAVTIMHMPRSALLGARKPLTIANSNVVRLFGGSTLAEAAGHASGQASDYLGQAAPADQVGDALTQAQELATQAAAYLKWAQYALVAIGILLVLWGIYRYARAWIWPAPEPVIPDDVEGVDLPLPAPRRKRRSRKATSRRRKVKKRRAA